MRAVRLMLQNKISGLPVVDANGQVVGIVTEGDFLRRGELGTQRRRPRWLEFLLGPGRLAAEYVQCMRAEGRRDHDARARDHHRRDTARRGRASDGASPHQASAGRAGRQARRHRQPRQSPACAGKPCARGQAVGRRRCRDPRPDHGGMRQAALGAARQCSGARRRGRALGRDHR